MSKSTSIFKKPISRRVRATDRPATAAEIKAAEAEIAAVKALPANPLDAATYREALHPHGPLAGIGSIGNFLLIIPDPTAGPGHGIEVAEVKAIDPEQVDPQAWANLLAAAPILRWELGKIADALARGETVTILPGTVKAENIAKAMRATGEVK